MTTDLVVTQRSKAPHPTVWLEVTYDGTTPPLALFADLEMIGWRPPVPASPPAGAIDWSTPNAVTGERFTIRPWTVEAAVVEPPRGSGSRGHWTEADRAVFLVALEGVLRRYGIGEPAAPAEPEAPAAPPASEPAASVAPPAVAPPEPAPTPAPAAPSAPAAAAASREEIGSTIGPRAAASTPAMVRAVLPVRLQRDVIGDAIAPLGVTSHIGSTEKAVTCSYRGSTFERLVRVDELEVLCDPPLVEVVCAVLRDLGLEPTTTLPADPDPGGTDAPLAWTAVGAGPHDLEPPAPPSGVRPDPGTSQLAVVVEPAREDRAVAALARHAIGRVQVERTTMARTTTYRGTPTTTNVAAVRVHAPVEADEADAVRLAVAAALGLDAEDASRVSLVVALPEDADDDQSAVDLRPAG